MTWQKDWTLEEIEQLEKDIETAQEELWDEDPDPAGADYNAMLAEIHWMITEVEGYYERQTEV